MPARRWRATDLTPKELADLAAIDGIDWSVGLAPDPAPAAATPVERKPARESQGALIGVAVEQRAKGTKRRKGM